MKIFGKVKSIEVKRAFIFANKMRWLRKKRMKYMPEMDKHGFLKKFKQAEKIVGKYTEKKMDKIIADEWNKREKAYNSVDWYRAIVSINEIGVWRRAGGLPSSWTCCSLAETAKYVKRGLRNNDKKIRARSKRSILRTMKFVDIISKKKYLFPIVFESEIGTRGRRWCKTKTKGDIDDGCMRSIALAIAGYKKLNIYWGIKRKNT